MFSNLNNKINPKFLLIPILILGFILRSYKLAQNYIWRDEAFYWHTTQFGFNNIFDITKWDTQPPLYSYAIFIWTKVFGDSPFALRSLALVFGMLVIYMIYRFTLKQTNSTWIALLSALLVAVNPELMIYSQESRSYTTLTFLTLLLAYLLSNKLTFKLSILTSIVAIIGLFTNSLFIIIVPLLYLWHWYFYGKNNLKNVLALFISTIILYIPYIPVLIQNTKDTGQSFWLKFEPLTAIQNNLAGLFTSYHYNLQYTWTGVLLSGILSTVVIGLILGIYQEYKNNRIRLLIMPLMFLTTMYFASFKTPMFYIRYIQYVIPFIVIIVAIGYYRIYVNNKLASALMIFILTFSSIALYITDIKNVPTNANYSQTLRITKAQDVQNVFNPDPHITFDVIAYYNKQNKLGLNNYILQYPKQTQKQFQTGLIKDNNKVNDIKTIKSMMVITEWDNQDAKAFLNEKNFCLINTQKVDVINLDYYEVCQL